jgi:hypothetical protein
MGTQFKMILNPHNESLGIYNDNILGFVGNELQADTDAVESVVESLGYGINATRGIDFAVELQNTPGEDMHIIMTGIINQGYRVLDARVDEDLTCAVDLLPTQRFVDHENQYPTSFVEFVSV